MEGPDPISRIKILISVTTRGFSLQQAHLSAMELSDRVFLSLLTGDISELTRAPSADGLKRVSSTGCVHPAPD